MTIRTDQPCPRLDSAVQQAQRNAHNRVATARSGHYGQFACFARHTLPAADCALSLLVIAVQLDNGAILAAWLQPILAASNFLIGLVIGSLIVGLLLLGFCNFFFQLRLKRPLAKIRATIDQMAEGDLHHPIANAIAGEREDEVGGLATALDQAMTKLAQREASLHAAVCDREARAQEKDVALIAANQQIDVLLQRQQETENALREAEARYRLLVEKMPAITYTAALGEQVRLLDISPQVAQLGFAAADWIAAPERFLRQIHQEDRLPFQVRLQKIQATGKPSELEYRIYGRDERVRWVHDHASVIHDENGLPLCIQGIMFDITRHKETEAAVQDGAQRIRLIADNLPALIAYVDNNQLYQFANRQFEEWYSTTSIVGRHLRDVAGEQNYRAIQDYVETALAGTPITFDYARTYPDGRRRFVELAYIPHIQADGKVLGFFTLVQDVTERKEAEEHIKASLDEKVVLLKEIHHRVKNNLQVITSLLYLQAEQIDDPAMRAILQDSQNRVRSMALIHEKLYQAKDLARVDIGEYIQNLTGYLFRSYATQASNVALRVAADNIYLAIDTAMPCGLIINELLSNALKHGFPDGRSGEVFVGLQKEADHHITLCVSDTGIGFPRSARITETATLGLQLVNTLVQQLDGTLELRHDGGAKFLIRFFDPH